MNLKSVDLNNCENCDGNGGNFKVLETYDEMARLAAKKNSDFTLYVGRKQAYEEFQIVMQSGMLKDVPQEDIKEIMVSFYKGVDLHYSKDVEV